MFRLMILAFCNHNTPKLVRALSDIIKALSDIINFVFKLKVCSKARFSATSIYWTSKGLDKTSLRKNLIEAIIFLIKSCYFTIRNTIFKQDIGIPMSTDPAPF